MLFSVWFLARFYTEYTAVFGNWKQMYIELLHSKFLSDRYTLNRSFLVFGSDDRTYMTAARFPKMLLITITPGCDGNVTFQAPDMPELQYRIPDYNDDLKTSTCM